MGKLSRQRGEKNDFTGSISWTKEPERLHQVVDQVQQTHATELVLARCLGRQYWNRPLAAEIVPDTNYTDTRALQRTTNRVLSEFGFNVTREVIDAMTARVCRQLAAKIITVGGDNKLQNQATKLTRYVDSLNKELNTRDVLQRMAVDACSMRGFGAGKVAFDTLNDSIRFDRLDPLGVFFPFEEGERPVHMFVRSAVPREKIQDLYPKKADAIGRLPKWRRPAIAGIEPTTNNTCDTVRIDEGWKIQQGESIPGHYTMAADKVVLENEKYTHPFHQVVLIRFFPEFTGAGGVAAGRILAPYHRWRNQLLRTMHDSLLGALPRRLMRVDTICEDNGDIPWQDVKWSGTQPPTLEVPNPVPSQVFDMFHEIEDGAFNEMGVSRSMSAAQMPQGITSGQAIRDYAGFADDRLQDPSERWKSAWVDVARAMVGISADAFAGNSVLMRAPGKDFLEEIKWADVDMRKNKYKIEFTITSGLTGTVSAKIQQLVDLQGIGLADAMTLAKGLADDLPDCAALFDRLTAPLDLATRMVEDALNGDYTPPTGLMGPDCLNYIKQIGAQMYCRALVNKNHTPEQLECLRKLMKAAQRKEAPPLPPIQPVQSAPGLNPGSIQAPGMQGPPS
jgi:hypothetical protein